MRVSPKPWIGFSACLIYLIVVVGLGLAFGIPYDEAAASTSNIWWGAVSVAAACLGVVILVTWLRWWRPVLGEGERSQHAWPVIVDVIMFGSVITSFATTRWSGVAPDYVFAALVMTALIGFGEELVSRGVLIVALRGKLTEVWVWLVSTLTFGVMHGANILNGAPIGQTIVQVIAASGLGTALYILRRASGAIILPMILHMLWDFSIFVHEHSPAQENAVAVFAIVILVVGSVSVRWVIGGLGRQSGVAGVSTVQR